MASLFTDVDDINREILLRIDVRTLINMPLLNTKAVQLCDDYFWYDRFALEYVRGRRSPKLYCYRTCLMYLEGKDKNGMLDYSIRNNIPELALYAITNGADPDCLCPYTGNVNYSEWPLIWACERGHFDVLLLLHNKGIDLNILDSLALTYAIYANDEGNKEEIVKFLLEKGANANTPPRNAFGRQMRDRTDIELLSWDIERNNGNLVQILIDAGRSVHHLQDDVLRAAVQIGRLDIVKILVKAGCNPNDRMIRLQRIANKDKPMLEYLSSFSDFKH